MRKFLALGALALTVLLPYQSRAASIPSNMIPDESASSSLSLKSLADYSKIFRDAGIGLSLGGMVGISFIMLSHGGFSTSNNEYNGDVFLTAMAAGLLGGAMAGVWEMKHDQALALSVSPGNGSTVPSTVKASLSF